MAAGTGKSKVGLFGSAEGRELESSNGALHVTLQGATSTGFSVPVTFEGVTASEIGVVHTEATSGTTVIQSAPGSGVDTEIRYFGIWNQTTDSRCKYELRLGATVVARGGLDNGAAFNANLVGAYARKTNQSLIGWVHGLDGGVTAIWTVRYKEI